MADFSLTTLFVVPVGNTLPSSGSTENLTAGQFGIFKNDYTVATAGNIASSPYIYLGQGRSTTYLQGSKRSDKIAASKVTEWYKTTGNPVSVPEIWEISNWTVQAGEDVSLTIRAHSSYIDTLYFNGLTRSVTVAAPCLACEGNPCANVNVPALIDSIIAKLIAKAPGNNADNISLSTFFSFERIGTDANAKLRIIAKPLTVYGQPCDVAASPYEYDRLWFRVFAYAGPATTQDFLVNDNCNQVARGLVTQRSNYPSGTSVEVAQLEKNYYSYQAGYLKSLYRMAGYNQNFESYVTAGTVYDLFYIKFLEYDQPQTWGDYIPVDAMVIIAAPQAVSAGINTVLAAYLGVAKDTSGPIAATTTSTTTTSTTTSTTTTLIP